MLNISRFRLRLIRFFQVSFMFNYIFPHKLPQHMISGVNGQDVPKHVALELSERGLCTAMGKNLMVQK